MSKTPSANLITILKGILAPHKDKLNTQAQENFPSIEHDLRGTAEIAIETHEIPRRYLSLSQTKQGILQTQIMTVLGRLPRDLMGIRGRGIDKTFPIAVIIDSTHHSYGAAIRFDGTKNV